MSQQLTPDLVEVLRQRKSAGESLAALAREVGVSWQKLWEYLRSPATAEPVKEFWPELQSSGSGCLSERYRPGTLAGMWGQTVAVRILRRFSSNPQPTAFLFEGYTGSGKTSAALSLAAELGCDVAQGEWGGVWEIASGEQTADAVRETGRRMWLKPMAGSGWKVIIVNEADRMSRPAEVVWLDLLEHLPRNTVVAFTTNNAHLLSSRFRNRCTRVPFESSAMLLAPAARTFVARLWKAETGTALTVVEADAVVESCIEDGSLSFRRLAQGIAKRLLERAGDE